MPIKNPLQVFEPEVDPGKGIKLDNWDVSLFLIGMCPCFYVARVERRGILPEAGLNLWEITFPEQSKLKL